jgi:hypothetical protein
MVPEGMGTKIMLTASTIRVIGSTDKKASIIFCFKNLFTAYSCQFNHRKASHITIAGAGLFPSAAGGARPPRRKEIRKEPFPKPG